MVAELHRLRHGVAEPRQHAGDVLLVALGPIQLLEAVPVGDDAGKRGAERIGGLLGARQHRPGPVPILAAGIRDDALDDVAPDHAEPGVAEERRYVANVPPMSGPHRADIQSPDYARSSARPRGFAQSRASLLGARASSLRPSSRKRRCEHRARAPMPAIPGTPRPWQAHRTGLSFVRNQE